MLQGQKSKRSSRAKRKEAQGEREYMQNAPVPAVEKTEGPPSPPPSGGDRDGAPRSPATSIAQMYQGATAPAVPAAGASGTSAERGAEGPDGEANERSSTASKAALPARRTRRDPLTKKVHMLMLFLLEKFQKKEPIKQADMLKVVNRRYKEHFPEILRRTTECMGLVFGLELKEVNPSTHTYAFVSKLGLSLEGSLSGNRGLPKSGLLMILLAVIFMKGNRATEEEIWEFLHALGIEEGRAHLIFGEPRRLITKDFVQEQYLEYRQVPGSDPPCYEFLWGPRARAETTKMKVLEVLAKINDTVPSSFPNMYEEALREEADRAGLRFAARMGTVQRASVQFSDMSLSSSHI